MIPAARLFRWLALCTLATAAAAAVPAILIPVALADAALLVAAFLDSRRAARVRLTARRVLPPMLVQGSAGEVALELEASAPRARRLGLEIQDTLHPALADQPHRARLEVMLDASRAGGAAVAALRLRYPLVPRRRGQHEAGPLVARVLGPWRLAWAQRDLLAPTAVRVYPQVRWGGRVGELLLLAQRHQLGQLKLGTAGGGAEPYALRPYLRGDPRNQIHWKASARRGELVTREDTLERGAPLVILFDCGRSMASLAGERSKLDYAVAAGLALLRLATARGDRVTVIAFSDRVERVLAVRPGSRGVSTAYDRLYDLEARLVEPVYDLASETVVQSGAARSTVVLFTSIADLAAAELLRSSLLDLRRRHRPLLVNLEDPVIEELAFGAPDDAPGAYAKLSSLDILLGNRALARGLRRAGVHAASASADRLALEALEGYLAMAR